MKRKNRKTKASEYDTKYSHIPIDPKERLNWLYDELKVTEAEGWDILKTRDLMYTSLYYNDINIILYEVPEGTPRPRARLINRKNLANMALSNSNFIQIYSITGAEDNAYMRRLVSEEEFRNLDQLICTPCIVTIDAFFKTPSSFNKKDKILSEIGLIRPLVKPDWDNIGKKYSDMFNTNVWLDDQFTVSGTVNKFYSCLPRVEIKLKYMNEVYNLNQFRAINGRQDFNPENMELNYFRLE